MTDFLPRFDAIQSFLGGVMDRLSSNHADNGEILRRIERNMERMMKTLDDLLEEVKNNTSISESVVTALAAQKKQLQDAIAGVGLSAADQAKIDQAFTDLANNDQNLAAAVVANTSAAPGSVEQNVGQKDGATDGATDGTK